LKKATRNFGGIKTKKKKKTKKQIQIPGKKHVSVTSIKIMCAEILVSSQRVGHFLRVVSSFDFCLDLILCFRDWIMCGGLG
jgi:hypothetical protein